MKRYSNKTKIPEYLKPLPLVKFDCTKNFYPISLIQIAIIAIKSNRKLFLGKGSWMDFVEVFETNSRIVPDTFRRLCHIQNPTAATAFILNKAVESKMNLDIYLQTLRIVNSRQDEIKNHWDMFSKRSPCSRIVIGHRRNKI